eukprot:TRINITY_DN26237_c0_g1_i1.p1 TRINITY_DN26237_c0_g1~~TRINITY_DN26237_c0_g1_i1.p1  ORF type:complete len:127 (-),score=18.95 TRINITY_DN26237_c0_g1_i1:28-360(-)
MASGKKRRVHVQGREPDELYRRVVELENQCRRAGIAVIYPSEMKMAPETPMLGHTKGNTKNNRKKIKNFQINLFVDMIRYLENLLQPTQNSSHSHSSSSHSEIDNQTDLY